MGLRRIEDKLTREAEMKRKGAEMALKSLAIMSQKIQELHSELQTIEKRYQGNIKKNPELAQRVMDLREELGLPRAIGIYDVPKPSFLKRLKGQDEYQNYLAVRILEIGKKQRSKTGGLLSVSELTLKLNDESKGITVSINDITTSLNLLLENKMIHGIRKLAGMKIIEFTDPNLSDDHQVILELAARFQGQIGLTALVQETNWSLTHVNQVLAALIQQKIATKKETLDGVVISFPAI